MKIRTFHLGVCFLASLMAFLVWLIAGLIGTDIHTSQTPVWTKVCHFSMSQNQDKTPRVVLNCDHYSQVWDVNLPLYVTAIDTKANIKCSAWRTRSPLRSDLDLDCKKS